MMIQSSSGWPQVITLLVFLLLQLALVIPGVLWTTTAALLASADAT